MNPDRGRPLAGMLVLDLSRLLPGPYCSWLLRSWGARVVKVEEPQTGDYLREAQPVWFELLGAGAESIAIDLKQPRGRELLLHLAHKADLVIESFRPGVMDRLGLSYQALAAVNPPLVLLSISGYADGRAGHDLNYLARSGLLSLMDQIPPIQLADLAGGLTGAAAALAAVVAARSTGRGAHVQTTLLDAAAGLGALLTAEARAGEAPQRGEMMLAGLLPCYQVYPTADGRRVALAALEPRFWLAFCGAVGRPDWAERQLDPTLQPELAALFAAQPLAHWAQVAGSGDLCLEPVLTVTEALAEHPPQSQPARFDTQRPRAVGPAPRRGEHTREILREWGVSRQEIQLLAAEAVIL